MSKNYSKIPKLIFMRRIFAISQFYHRHHGSKTFIRSEQFNLYVNDNKIRVKSGMEKKNNIETREQKPKGMKRNT